MNKVKYFIITIISIIAIMAIPGIVNASVEGSETTKTSTGSNVKWKYNLNANNQINEIVCSNVGEVSGELIIPETIDGHKIIGLNEVGGDGIFEGCTGLTKVTIPNTVREIGKYAFLDCTGLVEVNFSENLNRIGAMSFENCTGLTNIKIPNKCSIIEYRAFSGCAGITNLNIPNSVSSIENNAFSGCTGLKKLTFGTGITTIGKYAFNNCSGLSELIIPNNITTIGSSAFRYCTGLKKIKLSNNLSIINDDVFSFCSGLTEVKIPDSVTTINSDVYGAFEECNNLKKILIPSSVVSIGKDSFKDCKKLTIYGEKGSTAESHAKQYNIPFKVSSKWNEDVGDDITPPVVNKMYIEYSSVMGYWDSKTKDYRIPVGGKITIVVLFNENIKGSPANLTLKIGDKNTKEKNITNGVITGDKIVYEYIIEKDNLGLIAVSNIEGGNITDNSGNKAQLSVKELIVGEYNYGYAFADNTKQENNNGNSGSNNSGNNNNGGNTGNNNNQNNGSQNNSGGAGNNQNDKKDPTVADKEIPQTGEKIVVAGLTALTGIVVLGIVAYHNERKLKDIK